MSKPTILIVEDEEDVRFFLRAVLEQEGYKCLVASDGIGAIKHLVDNESIDTIICDVRMPIFGGDYWLNFLARFCVPHYRIVVQTGQPMDVVPEGMTLLLKPYNGDDILRVVKETARDAA